MKKGWNKDVAKDYLQDQLRYFGYKNIIRTPVSRTQERYGHTLFKTKQRDFYFIWKTAWFQSFNNLFNNYTKQPNAILGLGESINVEWLEYCNDKGIVPLYAHKDYPNVIYQINRAEVIRLLRTTERFKDIGFTSVYVTGVLKIYCEHYNLKREQWVENERDVGNYTKQKQKVKEITYSFPIKLLCRFKG